MLGFYCNMIGGTNASVEVRGDTFDPKAKTYIIRCKSISRPEEAVYCLTL